MFPLLSFSYSESLSEDMSNEIGQRQASHVTQQQGERDNGKFACRAGGGLETSVHAFGLRQLADVPEQKRGERADQRQGQQALRRTRLTELQSHAEFGRLVIAEILLDLHALRIPGADLLRSIAAQSGRVGKQPWLARTGARFAPRFRRGAMAYTAVTFAPAHSSPNQHHVADETIAACEGATAPALRLAGGLGKPAPGILPIRGLARDMYPGADTPNPHPLQALDLGKPRPVEARIGHDDDLPAHRHPLMQSPEQGAFAFGIAQLGARVDPLVDRQTPPHPRVHQRSAQFHKLAPGGHRRPVHGNHHRLRAVAQPVHQRRAYAMRLAVDARASNEPIDPLERRLELALADHPARQPRETQPLPAHHRYHRRAPQTTPRGMDRIQLIPNKCSYNLRCVRVHDSSPRWLVPTQRKNRSCTRRFSLPYRQAIDKYSLFNTKAGETSALTLPLKARECFAAFPSKQRKVFPALHKAVHSFPLRGK